MSQTLLIDLDDTLLSNPLDSFLPAYLQALSSHLAPYADPQRLIEKLLSSTRKMVLNRRPDCTLKHVFDDAFYPSLGLHRDEIQKAIDDFYAQVFPTLKNLTRPRPQAIRLVEAALSRGLQIAIATNPLFPRTAIEQRLEWAGLPASQYPFSLIASYETFHFAKPHPSFFAEVLARLGWPEGPVIAVGNDLLNDIEPAQKLGLPSFWVSPEGTTLPPKGPAPTARGDLDALLSWLESTPEESLLPDYDEPEAMLAVLRSSPAALSSLVEPLPLEMWARRPEPDEWSLTEILCHLRDVENEVNLPRLRRLLEESNPFLAGKDTDPWAEERAYIRQNGPQALQRFTGVRMDLLDLLDGLAPDGWQRTARHAIFGPTRLSELVSINAGHDRLHVQQAVQVLAALQP